MKRALMMPCLLLLASVQAGAGESIRLRVSATVPPRPCEFPNSCDPVPATAQTRVVIDKDTVRYVGSTPEVTQKDGLLSVKF